MSLRIFLFCDFCNPEGIRTVDERRAPIRDTGKGRRNTDNKVWFEGSAEEAVINQGWHITEDNKHICPDCQHRLESWPGKRLGDFALSA